jgi:hypothetical protein
MKGGDNVYQHGIYVATKALLKSMAEPTDVEAELVRMASFSVIYASILIPLWSRRLRSESALQI